LTGIQCRELELERREMERCKIRNREKDMGKKEGNNEDREKLHEKIDEKMKMKAIVIPSASTLTFLMLMISELKFAGCRVREIVCKLL
jgi:hypothetical protein